MDNDHHPASISSNTMNNNTTTTTNNNSEFVDRFASLNMHEFVPINLSNNSSRSLPNYIDISYPPQSTSSNSVSNISNMIPSTLNPSAQEFVPRAARTVMTTVYSSYRAPQLCTVEDYMSLSYMKDFIHQISNQPNLYDLNIEELTLVVNYYLDEDDCVLELIVNQIVDQSIIDGNFRHNGVRLCDHFMNELKKNASGQTFRELLIKRIQREGSRKLTDISSVKTFEHVRGLALFTADLYARRDEPDLATYLLSLLLNILSFKTQYDANVKCVWQVMKLCGQQMYQYFDKEPDYDNLMAKLKETLEWNISASNKNMVNKILTLSENDWIEPSASTVPSTLVNPYYNMENVPVGPEGNNYEPTPTISTYYNSGYPDVYDFGSCGDGNNAEVCKDFENFLKSTQQS